MRISDWSSDVCSSDLDEVALDPVFLAVEIGDFQVAVAIFKVCGFAVELSADPLFDGQRLAGMRKGALFSIEFIEVRSEERGVGKECVRMCRSRWSQYH